METFWSVILVVSLCVCMLFMKALNSVSHPLPPGPTFKFPIITNIFSFPKSLSELHAILRNLHTKHGPIFTFHCLYSPNIFISDGSLAHQALIQNGAVFADRPKTFYSKKSTGDQLNITSSSYGATWRVLRRNLVSAMLNPCRFGSFSETRKWVLDDLLNRFKSDAEKNHSSVKVMEHVHHAMFTLLVSMCFGEQVAKDKAQHIKQVQHRLMSGLNRFGFLNFLPKVVKCVLFRKRWLELLKLREAQKVLFVQLVKERKNNFPDHGGAVCYVDTLLKLKLPEENRELDEGEVVSLCSEFLTAGTDTTSTALEWVMANLVKYEHVQRRVVEEIEEVVKERKEVKEEDLNKLPYLKAVILEGLRRHPPTHLVVPHAVTEDVILNGYLVPKTGTVNFMVAEMGWDSRVWEDPMEFKPERFLDSEFEEFDITGGKEIKMMPFGAGRRICPAYNLAMLHLQYFVANLVWNFEWKASNGGNVDLTRKQEFTMVMKYPLQAQIFPRF